MRNFALAAAALVASIAVPAAASAAEISWKSNSNWFGYGATQAFYGSRVLMLKGPTARALACKYMPGVLSKDGRTCGDASDVKIVSNETCHGRKAVYRFDDSDNLHIALCTDKNFVIGGVEYAVVGSQGHPDLVTK